MSRIGRMPITVPAGVTVNIAEGNVVTVKGPKGELTQSLRPELIIKQEGTTITVERPSDVLPRALRRSWTSTASVTVLPRRVRTWS